jgi:hypothetical protein
MKTKPIFVFEDGSISMKVSGYSPSEIGSVELTFRDDDLGYSEDVFRTARLDRSEVVEMRDWLDEWLKKTAQPSPSVAVNDVGGRDA